MMIPSSPSIASGHKAYWRSLLFKTGYVCRLPSPQARSLRLALKACWKQAVKGYKRTCPDYFGKDHKQARTRPPDDDRAMVWTSFPFAPMRPHRS
ncbi:MAG: hypothetical protein IT320_21095 [Anaerolineae bacterium]|nr:hypothetical protein [Anaerolineae bacterium]